MKDPVFKVLTELPNFFQINYQFFSKFYSKFSKEVIIFLEFLKIFSKFY